jgi:hypothetical protein
MSDADGDRDLFRRVQQVIRMEWDPIGIGHCPEAMHEYDGYCRDVFDLLREQPTVEEVYGYLWSAETGHLGLAGDSAKTETVAKRLHKIAVEYGL